MRNISWLASDQIHLTYALLDNNKRKPFYWVAMFPPEHTCYDADKPWMGYAETADNTMWFATEAEAKMWVEAVYVFGAASPYNWQPSYTNSDLQVLEVDGNRKALYWVHYRSRESPQWRGGAGGQHHVSFQSEEEAKRWVEVMYSQKDG